MSNPLGHTRTVVRRDYALIAPDTHVSSPLPGWERTSGVVQISPAMGAGFVQYIATLAEGSLMGGAAAGVERFVYVLEGRATIDGRAMGAGGYAYFPAGQAHAISGAGLLLVIEKRYEARAGVSPRAVIGNEAEVAGGVFMGDEAFNLKLLLPDEAGFDLAMNIFTYAPGAMLPQVECHVMEHGLIMLQGAGVYRLGDEWFPVAAGDVIWMGPYCPQWYIAGGKTPTRYLYYKNVNRDSIGVR